MTTVLARLAQSSLWTTSCWTTRGALGSRSRTAHFPAPEDAVCVALEGPASCG